MVLKKIDRNQFSTFIFKYEFYKEKNEKKLLLNHYEYTHEHTHIPVNQISQILVSKNQKSKTKKRTYTEN